VLTVSSRPSEQEPAETNRKPSHWQSFGDFWTPRRRDHFRATGLGRLNPYHTKSSGRFSKCATLGFARSAEKRAVRSASCALLCFKAFARNVERLTEARGTPGGELGMAENDCGRHRAAVGSAEGVWTRGGESKKVVEKLGSTCNNTPKLKMPSCGFGNFVLYPMSRKSEPPLPSPEAEFDLLINLLDGATSAQAEERLRTFYGPHCA